MPVYMRWLRWLSLYIRYRIFKRKLGAVCGDVRSSLVTIVYGYFHGATNTAFKTQVGVFNGKQPFLYGIWFDTDDSCGYGRRFDPYGGIHSILKILAFFCVGAILYKTHREYVYEINGFGRKMPITMATFTISAIGLMGIPPLPGFLSKWNWGTAAVESGNPLAYAGIGGIDFIHTAHSALYDANCIQSVFPE